jgi:transmembrane sensor
MTRLDELWEGYLTQTLTGAELRELLGLIGTDDPAVGDAIGEMLESGAYRGLAGTEKEEMLFRRILERSRQSAIKTIPAMVPYFKRTMAAAAVFILLGTGGYFLLTYNAKTKIVQTPDQHLKRDVAPGTNGAVLTLANGSTIVLDSSSNGVFAQQGNSRLFKQNNGQLAYRVDRKSKELLYNTLTTARGRQFQVILPDGTKVWLNAATSLRYPAAFVGNERVVEVAGEAYFEVAHNPKMPFRVKVGDQLIEDIGTAFNINAYEDEQVIRTSLLTGAIKLSNGRSSVILRPGEQVAAGKGDGLEVKSGDIEQAIAWKDGLFAFRDANIQTIMRQLARWYDVEVKYEGAVSAQQFTGKIDRSLSLARVLGILGKTRVHFRIEEDKKIVILP